MSFPFDLHSAAVSDSHLPCHDPTMSFFSRPQHSRAVERRPCCAVALRRTAWSDHGMASVNQTRPHCVNQMGKTHSKPLAARHNRGTAWARHAMCESAFCRPVGLRQFEALRFPYYRQEHFIFLSIIYLLCVLVYLLLRFNGH